jgi:hypothetical protein
MLRLAVLLAPFLGGCAIRDGAETSLAFALILGTMLIKLTDVDPADR